MSQFEQDNSLRLYLREISKTDLLTKEEEIELANRIKKGDKKAREHMIKANLRLVVKIAQDYSGYGLPLADLISEGNTGLMKAVERFDPNKGGKLSTYGSWWIKQSIKRALCNQSKTIRLPVHMVDKITRMRRIQTMLTEALGHEPTDEELAEELGIPEKKLALLKRASKRPKSLDKPTLDSSATFGETVEDPKATNPSAAFEHNNNAQQADDLLELLDERERRIIDARFGLDGKKPMTLEEVGAEFGVTREYIRQLQDIALNKMRKALHRQEVNPELSKTLTTIQAAQLLPPGTE